MVTAKVAPEHCLALARAASQHASAAHALGHVVLWLAVIGLAAACFAAYRVSLWLHPFTLCRRCGGSGITAGFFPVVAGVLPQMRRPRAGSPARHDDGRPVGTVPAVTAGSRYRQPGLPAAARARASAGCRADAGTRDGPGTAARDRELGRPRPGGCPAPVLCAAVPLSAAAGSRAAGLAPGAGRG